METGDRDSFSGRASEDRGRDSWTDSLWFGVVEVARFDGGFEASYSKASPKTGTKRTSCARNGTGFTSRHRGFARINQEPKIEMGFMFEERDDFIELAIDPDPRICAGLHLPARIGSSQTDEPL